MTVSFRKVNSMIESEVSNQEFSEEQKKILGDLCKKIYLIESSMERISSQIVSDIKGQISLKADDFRKAS